MKPIRIGLLVMVPYLLYAFYCIARAVAVNDAGSTQAAVAFWSFPTSMVAFVGAHQALDWIGPYGSAGRRFGEWSLLILAGCLQYFLLGFLVGKLMLSNAKKTE